MSISTHPQNARYFASRSEARDARKRGERVVRLGQFSNGSFGCYLPIDRSGRTIGGPNARVYVWMVARA